MFYSLFGLFGYYKIIRTVVNISSLAVEGAFVEARSSRPSSRGSAANPSLRSPLQGRQQPPDPPREAHFSPLAATLEVVVGFFSRLNVAAVRALGNEDEKPDDGEGGEAPPEDIEGFKGVEERGAF